MSTIPTRTPISAEHVADLYDLARTWRELAQESLGYSDLDIACLRQRRAARAFFVWRRQTNRVLRAIAHERNRFPPLRLHPVHALHQSETRSKA